MVPVSRGMEAATFGVELEFLVVFHEQLFATHFGHLQVTREPRAGPVIQKYLQALNVPATGQEDLDEPWEEDESGSWSVKEDLSLKLSEGELAQVPAGYRHDTVELSSPKYNLSASGEFDVQLHDLLIALQTMAEETGCYFLTNSSCGLHVHVGNGSCALPLKTVKRVMQIFTAHERNFDALHAASRITLPVHPGVLPSGSCPTPYFAPLSFFLRKSDHHAGAESSGAYDEESIPATQPVVGEDGLSTINPFAMVARIEQADSYADLGRFTAIPWQDGPLDGHASAVNFDQMFPDEDSGRFPSTMFNTIEFRQHAGTLDEWQIKHYVEMLVRIVEFATGAPDQDVVGLIVSGANINIKLPHVLLTLGCSDEIVNRLCRDKTRDLVARNLHPSQVNLEGLRWTNLAERARDNDPSKIVDLINEKLRGYYGWEPTAGDMPLTYRQVSSLVQSARHVAVAGHMTHAGCACAVDSEALVMVYASLNRIYQGLDSGMSHWKGEYEHDPVTAELGRWGVSAFE